MVALGHEIIRSAWMAASVLVKYYIAGTLAYLTYRDNFSVEELRNNLLDNSKIFIFTLLLAGILLALFQIEINALSPVASQIIALAYLGFLFWVY